MFSVLVIGRKIGKSLVVLAVISIIYFTLCVNDKCNPDF